MSKDVQVLLTGPLYPLVMTSLDAKFTALRPWQSAPLKDFLQQSHPGIRGVASNGSHGAIGAAVFDRLPDLEIIANFGVGYDNVDVDEATRRGIKVTNTPDVLTDEVADVTLGLLIATVRQLPRAEQYLRAGSWREKPFPLTATLRGRKVGILGLGRIGKAIATRCAAFGLSIAYHGRNRQADVPYDYFASSRELAEAVDILIAVAPGGEGTRHMVDAAVLAALGAQGVFINVARGSVVDEDALIQALTSKTILAAGLDVYENEPKIRPEFMTIENAVLLPHVGSGSVHTRDAMGQLVVDNLTSWFDGKGALTPVN